MNKSIKAAQGGFTLIELIVVIVILGILAATALPKFASLSGEARLASLNAAKGSLAATSAMTHGKFLVTPGGAGTVTVEGTDITMNMTSGYPEVLTEAQAKTLAVAAGLSASDYAVYTKDSATAQKPAGLTASQMAIVPASLANTAKATRCFVLYTGATTSSGTTSAPAAVLGSTSAECE